MFLGFSLSQWFDLATSIGMVFIAILAGRWFVTFIIDRALRRLIRQTKTTFDDMLLATLRTPLYAYLIFIVLNLAINRLDSIPQVWRPRLDDIFFTIYLIIGFFLAYFFTKNFLEWYGREMADRTETELDEQLLPFFSRVTLIILSVIALIILLSHFNVDVSALVTTLGVGSLAIALAAQAALSDTISGFIIMIDRPYRIGDRIELLDLDTWGDVVDIGLRSSRIRTRDNRMVIVPNSVISKALIVNHSFPDEHYRIQVHIGVAYGSDIEHVRTTMIQAVEQVEGVDLDRPVEALFLEFGDSALIFRLRWWINSYIDTRRMFDKVNTAVYKALNEAGIEVPIPQRAIHHQISQENAEQINRMLKT